MSVSMTLPAVHARIKTVTRRHPTTWMSLKAGDRLTLIEKGMGLPKGAKQVVVCEVEIVSVDIETLAKVTASEVVREGLWEQAESETADWIADGYYEDDGTAEIDWFRQFWLKGHGYPKGYDPLTATCRRIEWRYLDGGAS